MGNRTVEDRKEPRVKVELSVREYYLLREILRQELLGLIPEDSDAFVIQSLGAKLEEAANHMWED